MYRQVTPLVSDKMPYHLVLCTLLVGKKQYIIPASDWHDFCLFQPDSHPCSIMETAVQHSWRHDCFDSATLLTRERHQRSRHLASCLCSMHPSLGLHSLRRRCSASLASRLCKHVVTPLARGWQLQTLTCQPTHEAAGPSEAL